MEGRSTPSAQEIEQNTLQLLAIIQQLASELYKGQTITVELDSSLDQDLGLDSLARAELMSRAEQCFNVTLFDQLLAQVETPRDLLQEILRAAGKTAATLEAPETSELSLGTAEEAPNQVQTLQEVLDWHLQKQADRPHIIVCGDRGDEDTQLSYRELHQQAEQLACGLLNQGLEPGQAVALMLPTSADYFYCFFAVLLANAIPVPIYPPTRPSQIEDHLRRHAGILNNACAQLLITVPEAKAVSRLLQSHVPGLRRVLTVDELRHAPQQCIASTAGSQDIALLQYTSGSTGNPKGVVLNHSNLLENIRAMGRVVRVEPDDVFVSWLPLYHDMGLIGAWFSSLYYAFPLVVMSPLTFLARPLNWLQAIQRYRGTISGGPNFAYELCLRKVTDEDLQNLDLSSWRFAFNGAEPISPSTMRRFTERFAPCGFCGEAMAPVYGLAESSVGLAFPPAGRAPLIDRVQRLPMERQCQAITATEEDDETLEFVACGQPLPGHQLRVVDGQDRELPDRHEGNLQFKGPSATSGYFHAADKTSQLFHGDWLDTGDRAYLADGDIYVTGRIKDVIIRAGRNLYPHELEEAVGQVEGVRKGCVAVFASTDDDSGTERLVVLAETHHAKKRGGVVKKADVSNDTETLTRLRQDILGRSLDLLDTPPDDIVLAPPHTIPKTSSGKIRRSMTRQLYEQKALGKGQHALWWQLLSITLTALRPQLHRSLNQLMTLAYGAWCWLVLGLLVIVVWPIVAIIPSPRVCWPLVRKGCQLLLRLTATRLKVRGLEQIEPQQTYVFVANHASYLDSIMLIAGIPVNFSFVAKSGLHDNLFSRVFLRHLNTEFVEHMDSQRGVADARYIAGTATSAYPLMFFPEGTFTRSPGLVDFHLGAFVAATETQNAVVPITLKGVRSKLRDESWLPRRGDVEIILAPPLQPTGSDWNSAIALRDRARAEILQRCGEPNLAQTLAPV